MSKLKEGPEGSREFLDGLQAELEDKTLRIARENPDPGQENFLPLEPEDLLTLSEENPQWYLESLEKVIAIARDDYDQAFTLVAQLVESGAIEAADDEDLVVTTFLRYLSEVYAARAKARNEQEREKIAKRIYNQMLKEAPYIRAAQERLGFDKLKASMNFAQAVSSVTGRVARLIEVGKGPEVSMEKGEEGSVVVGIDFRGRRAKAYQEPELSEDEAALEAKVKEVKVYCANFLDARTYQTMLVQPFQAREDFRIGRAKRETGLDNLGLQLCDGLRRYIQEPSLIHDLSESALLTELAVIMAFRGTADLLDGFEKRVNQQAFVVYCAGLIRNFVQIYQAGPEKAKDSGMYEDIMQIPYTVHELLGRS